MIKEKVYVYLIEAVVDHIAQYKIGISKSPERRILEMKTTNPNIVGVINEYLCDSRLMAHKIESWYHKYHMKKNINGEWFILNEKDIEEFTEKCKYFEKIIQTHLKIEKTINTKYGN